MNNIKPSEWIVNQLKPIIKDNDINNLLDVACGNGRHSKYFSSMVKKIFSIDNNLSKLNNFSYYDNIYPICFDLEKNNIWPFNFKFDVVVVVNYLYRENFNNILNLVKLNGYLIYETFAAGNEKFGKPKNKKFLLKENELKKMIGNNFTIINYYSGKIYLPKISIKQHCIAKRVA